VTAMVDLALTEQDTPDVPVALAGISERQGISLSYLEQLFGKLRRHGLVESVRGPGGGYRLSRARSELSVVDIVRAVDEHLDTSRCGGRGDCHKNSNCLMHGFWLALNQNIYSYLQSVSLDDLVTQHRTGKPLLPLAPSAVT